MVQRCRVRTKPISYKTYSFSFVTIEINFNLFIASRVKGENRKPTRYSTTTRRRRKKKRHVRGIHVYELAIDFRISDLSCIRCPKIPVRHRVRPCDWGTDPVKWCEVGGDGTRANRIDLIEDAGARKCPAGDRHRLTNARPHNGFAFSRTDSVQLVFISKWIIGMDAHWTGPRRIILSSLQYKIETKLFDPLPPPRCRWNNAVIVFAAE